MKTFEEFINENKLMTKDEYMNKYDYSMNDFLATDIIKDNTVVQLLNFHDSKSYFAKFKQSKIKNFKIGDIVKCKSLVGGSFVQIMELTEQK